jgi:diacylglycerol kinase
MVEHTRLLKSFKYALLGLKKVFLEEQNFRIHAIIALLVIILGFYFHITVLEWIIVILLIALILILEIINSIFERLLDLLKPRIHEYVGDIKDMTAAVVFVGAIIAVIIGLIIFLPHILDKFKLI